MLVAFNGCGAAGAQVTTSPTPVEPQVAWTSHELTDAGVGVELPEDWRVIRHPGIYMAGPDVEPFDPRLTVGLRADVPLGVEQLAVTMDETWRTLHATGFYTTPITVGGVPGVAFWQLPNTCLSVYAPAHGVVRELTLGPALCTTENGQLTESGQRILDSVTVSPPAPAP